MLHRGIAFSSLALSLALAACGGAVDQGNGESTRTDVGAAEEAAPETLALSDEDMQRPWQQVPTPTLSLGGDVVETPWGWYSLSRRIFGPDDKAIAGMESNLYRSQDGVHWTHVPLPRANPLVTDLEDVLLLRDIAYFNGTLVLAGSITFSSAVLFTTTDGESFAQSNYNLRGNAFTSLSVAGGRLFALASTFAFSSPDGVKWSPLKISGIATNTVAYGNSRFLLAGGGGLLLSDDGLAWHPSNLDCTLEGTCIRDPDGGQAVSANGARFAAGWFYIDTERSMRSADGVSWQPNDGPVPMTQVGEYVIWADADNHWSAVKAGGVPLPLDIRSFERDEQGFTINPGVITSAGTSAAPLPAPDSVTLEIPGGGDCVSSRCIVLLNRLYIQR